MSLFLPSTLIYTPPTHPYVRFCVISLSPCSLVWIGTFSFSYILTHLQSMLLSLTERDNGHVKETGIVGLHIPGVKADVEVEVGEIESGEEEEENKVRGRRRVAAMSEANRETD